MMQPPFDIALLDSTLVQAALRALALALVVGAALTLLRVRNPHHQLAAWTAVLVSALAMPLLMTWMVVSVPMDEVIVPAGTIAEPLIELAANASAAPDTGEGAVRIDGELAAPPARDWTMIAAGVYAAIAGVLLLRLAVGLVLTARLRAASERVYALWTGDADIRMSPSVAAPVTVGSTILLPGDFETWSAEKRRAVLLHERAHVARGDFYVQILAAIHRAVFWFSPLAWWLHDRIAELAEDASDAEAASSLTYRADYAAVLLDFAQVSAAPRLKFAPIGVAMARPATVRRRIERVLEKKLPEAIGRGAKALTAAIVVAAGCAAAVSVVRTPAEAASGVKEAPLPAAVPVAPAAAAVPAARPAPPIPAIPPVPPAEFGTHGQHVWVPPIQVDVLPVRVDLPDVMLAQAISDADKAEFEADMKELRDAIAAAKAAGSQVSERVAARLEAAAERAQEKMERAQERIQERAERAAAGDRPRGPVTKESRTVADFTGVSFGGSGKVFITIGPKASLVLEADADTLSRTRTEVDNNGVLRIRRQNNDNWGHHGDITAYITTPVLKLARVSGSGDLKVAGFKGGETELSISGSGNVEADGALEKIDVDISGSGSARMEKLVVGDADVSISGSGSAVVDVRNELNVRVSGSGSVRYLTQPKDIDTVISGSGSVRRRDAT